MTPVEGLCMAGGGMMAQWVIVPAGSALPVAFSVVPTASTNVPLKLVAKGTLDSSDSVSKILQIEVNDCMEI